MSKGFHLLLASLIHAAGGVRAELIIPMPNGAVSSSTGETLTSVLYHAATLMP